MGTRERPPYECRAHSHGRPTEISPQEVTNFFAEVLKSLNDPFRRIAFTLLSGDANEIASPILTVVPPESITRVAHPMSGNSGQERPFHAADVFSGVNEFLSDAPIDWNLT
jgi:hypothetical protein